MAKPLALTSGEPAGIGPDIAIMAWLRRHELKLPAFYLRGDRGLLEQRATNARTQDRTRRRWRRGCGTCVRRCLAGGRDRSRRHGAARPARRQQRRGSHRLHSSGGRRRRCRKSRRGRHQSDCQKRALPRRLPASRPHRVSCRTRSGRRPRATAGDDAVVACPRRGAGNHPSSAARCHRAALERAHRHDRRGSWLRP